MRMMLIVIGLIGCRTPSDPVLDRMHENPDWCPSSVEEIEATLNRLECQHAVTCGDAYPSQEACEQEIAGKQPRPGEGECFDGCAMRECILWREENSTDCLANDPPDGCSGWIVPCP